MRLERLSWNVTDAGADATMTMTRETEMTMELGLGYRCLRVLGVGLLACAIGPGYAEAQEEAEGPQLDVMSFNIRYGTADDGEDSWANRRELLFDVIRDHDPDMIGIQEGLRFQLDELRAAVPGYTEIGVARDDGIQAGEYAAILYKTNRFALAGGGTFWFSDEPATPGSIGWGANLPRICSWARLLDIRSRRMFFVFNVHLDHQSQESRERSAQLLVERILARSHGDPVIVTGDFNAGEDNPAMTYLLGLGAAGSDQRLYDSFRVLHPDSTEVGTFNGFLGESSGPKIDAVLVSEGWKVETAAIVRTSRDGRYPSDHFPVVAALRRQRP